MTFEEYLDLLVQTVTKNMNPVSRSVMAAALGNMLRQASPDVTWKTFGKRTLSELLTDPRVQPHLRTFETAKGALAVSPVGELPAGDVPAIEVFNPLRKSVWEAFVLPSPSGRRFMHRVNGVIRAGLEIAPAPADDWVEIIPISPDEQREWARDFIASADGQNVAGAEQALATEGWHPYAFFQLLRGQDENIARMWNRFRSAKVSTRVQEWLTQHSLPVERGFQGATRPRQQEVGGALPGVQSTPVLGGEGLREAILLAISTLPLERLLEIPIPAGVMLSALSQAKTR
ncbi:hypothetical protein PEP31012_00628 [Pandoraea eparura]|uniref:Uncharacterized protein n=1 Tax=Pandoraea eparura TaxID=2508291 RepID=A0A5E4S885_9BURK|nr:hypothetical protein [Pandoraea eparura]VVD71505.1 hypothetical protein PEP31012_00628 [Pandoraea eparura]